MTMDIRGMSMRECLKEYVRSKVQDGMSRGLTMYDGYDHGIISMTMDVGCMSMRLCPKE